MYVGHGAADLAALSREHAARQRRGDTTSTILSAGYLTLPLPLPLTLTLTLTLPLPLPLTLTLPLTLPLTLTLTWAGTARCPVSPPYLPYISPISPGLVQPAALYFPHISLISPPYLLGRYNPMPYICPISSLYLPHISRAGTTRCPLSRSTRRHSRTSLVRLRLRLRLRGGLRIGRRVRVRARVSPQSRASRARSPYP